MGNRRVLLDAAAFADSPQRRSLGGVDADQVRGIVQRYLEACYDDLGKAPRLLQGDEVATVLDDLLPRHFGIRDPLAKHVESVLGAYLSYLAETEVVSAAFEQQQALAMHVSTFADIVKSGAAHGDGIALTSKTETVVHRADKTGRNDPCPCGSGKKFKKCCMRLGGAS